MSKQEFELVRSRSERETAIPGPPSDRGALWKHVTRLATALPADTPGHFQPDTGAAASFWRAERSGRIPGNLRGPRAKTAYTGKPQRSPATDTRQKPTSPEETLAKWRTDCPNPRLHAQMRKTKQSSEGSGCARATARGTFRVKIRNDGDDRSLAGLKLASRRRQRDNGERLSITAGP